MKKTDLCKYIVELKEKREELKTKREEIANLGTELGNQIRKIDNAIEAALILRDYMPTDNAEEAKCQK